MPELNSIMRSGFSRERNPRELSPIRFIFLRQLFAETELFLRKKKKTFGKTKERKKGRTGRRGRVANVAA